MVNGLLVTAAATLSVVGFRRVFGGGIVRFDHWMARGPSQVSECFEPVLDTELGVWPLPFLFFCFFCWRGTSDLDLPPGVT